MAQVDVFFLQAVTLLNLCLMSEVSMPCPAVDPLLLSSLKPDLYILTTSKSLGLKKRNITLTDLRLRS